jgi:hypothetical protein
MLRLIFNALPDIASIFLALFLSAIALALFFLPEALKKLENQKTKRVILAWILIVVALFFGGGGFFSSIIQKRDLTNQMTALVNATKIQATTDDIKKLGTDIQTGMQTGFDRIVAAVSGKKIVTTPTIPTPTPTMPTIENARLVQRSTPSDDPQLPYGLQVIIQSNIVIQPIAFAFECDGKVGKINFFIAGQTAYMGIQTSINNNIATLRINYPPLTPESPLVVTLLSKSQIRVVKAYKLTP